MNKATERLKEIEEEQETLINTINGCSSCQHLIKNRKADCCRSHAIETTMLEFEKQGILLGLSVKFEEIKQTEEFMDFYKKTKDLYFEKGKQFGLEEGRKEVFDRMIKMEGASARNPNLMQTYEVMWKKLKQEMGVE